MVFPGLLHKVARDHNTSDQAQSFVFPYIEVVGFQLEMSINPSYR